MKNHVSAWLAIFVLAMVASARAQRAPVAVSVKDFGAKGDGKADDTAAVRAAAKAATGGTLTFTPDATREEAEVIASGLTRVAKKMGNEPRSW